VVDSVLVVDELPSAFVVVVEVCVSTVPSAAVCAISVVSTELPLPSD
jgi:hypothetical protein